MKWDIYRTYFSQSQDKNGMNALLSDAGEQQKRAVSSIQLF
jgi:hypothetical protein